MKFEAKINELRDKKTLADGTEKDFIYGIVTIKSAKLRKHVSRMVDVYIVEPGTRVVIYD